MARTRVAPVLSRIVLPRYQRSQERYIGDEDWPATAAELRALLRVARAVVRVMRNYPGIDDGLESAVVNLDRVSGRQRKGGRKP